VPTCEIIGGINDTGAHLDLSRQTGEMLAVNAPSAPSLRLPFPLELVALSMLRVMLRRDHEGGLQADTPDACRVVLQFAGFFRNLSTESLTEQLQSSFRHVVLLPIARAAGNCQVRTILAEA
jgi:hypothetical protein